MTSHHSPHTFLASLKRTIRILFASIASGLLAVSTLPAPATATTVPAARAPAPVVLILLENHSRSAITAKAAPYLTNFAKAGRTFTHYDAIEHPSLPNYLDIVSGGNQGCTTDSCPRQNYTANNLFHQVGNWQSWQESMPSHCALSSSDPYAVKHNPAAYFTDLTSTCSTQDVPYPTTLPTTMPAFTFITPDLNDDMHDGTVAEGDAWCKAHIPALLRKGCGRHRYVR
ncbi:MAG: alkaline phosphatase family protein [Actinomycetota bacterium]|nr:alkaline phosphatase family protein [Actinomycetota bacterium]